MVFPLPQIEKKTDQYRKKSAAPEAAMTIPGQKRPEKTKQERILV